MEVLLQKEESETADDTLLGFSESTILLAELDAASVESLYFCSVKQWMWRQLWVKDHIRVKTCWNNASLKIC